MKKPTNQGKQWKPEEVKELKKLAKVNTPTRVIGMKLGRSEDSVRSKSQQEKLSLKPTNQKPYNRLKK